ncbi:MAG: hypothetical protein FJ086_02620 [Deltaproteobacteria bacterium]|nr:hypothetical protein [Deltaproteobacteria bacterium]
MKARGAWSMGALAAVGLAAAYGAWQREPESTAEAVVVLEAGRKDVQRVRYEDAARFVELRPREGAGEGAVWVRVGTREAPPGAQPQGVDAGTPGAGAPDAGTEAAAAAAAKVPERELPGNDLAQKLFQRFSPLRATRALGALEPAKLEELGLASPTRRLLVGLRSGEVAWDVGASSLGLTSPYLRDGKDGKVYLLGGGIISDLDAGQARLVDRRLHTFTAQDYDALVVTKSERKRAFRATSPQGGPGRLVDAQGTADDFARNWHDRLWRLAAGELLGRDETPPEGPPTVALRLDYARSGSPLGHVEVAFEKSAAWARTEYTAGWVKLSGALEGLEQEAERVLNGQ